MNFKDAYPEETLTRIYSILNSINLTTKEVVMVPMDNIFSVMVNIENTSIFANGKGVDVFSAKASAYGELVERLDNLLHFRSCYVHSVLRSRSYEKYYPTDVLDKSLSENQKNKWMMKVFDSFGIDKVNELLSRSSYQNSHQFSCFRNIDDVNDEIFIPYSLLDYFYGSNGMAAGNTYEEAVVQAISETIERHAIKELVINKHVSDLLDITTLISEKFVEIKAYIASFEEKGYTTKILDYSRQGRFPVIIAIFFNRKNYKYFIKFGCHPDLFVATLRTFTEFLQNRDLSDMATLTLFSSDIENTDPNKNFSSIFHDGQGVFPYETFCSPVATSLPSIWKNRITDNKKLLNSYKKLFRSINKEIFLAKRNYLGFDTVQVIIPGFSEVSTSSNFSDLENAETEKKAIQQYVKLCRGMATNKDILDLVQFWESTLVDNAITFLSRFRIPLIIKPDPIYNLIEGHYILTVLNILIDDVDKAYYHSSEWLNKKHEFAYHPFYNYVSALSSILFIKKYNFGEDKIKSFARNYHLDPLIIEAFHDITQKKIFNMLPIISCPDCDMCDFMGECKYDYEDKIICNMLTRFGSKIY